jgi:hypothetical protein
MAQPPQFFEGRFVGGIPLAEVAAVHDGAFGQAAVFHVSQDAGHARTKEA